ncbi:MAG: zf-HC2 domain-containing protein [bacterium]
MTCEQANQHFPDYLNGDLEETTKRIMQMHVEQCAHCRTELAEAEAIWARLGRLPEEPPPAALQARFYAMLAAYEQGLQHARPRMRLSEHVNAWLERWWPKQPAWQFAVAVLCLGLGLLAGRGWQSSPSLPQEGLQVAQLRSEVQTMQQMVALSLLQQPSPSERLRGVSWSYQVAHPDQQMLAALMQTLNYDANVNVRLSALEALHTFADQDTVRQALAASLPRQNSPLVQIRLINLIVELRTRQANETLRQLLQDEQLSQEVRQRAEWGLRQLL